MTDVALRALGKVDIQTRERIFEFLTERLSKVSSPRSIGEPLRGRKSGMWRYRVGDYRIICRIEDRVLTVLVLNVGHRSLVYKERK